MNDLADQKSTSIRSNQMLVFDERENPEKPVRAEQRTTCY